MTVIRMLRIRECRLRVLPRRRASRSGLRPTAVTGASGGVWVTLMRTPRWRSESAFADALYLPIRSQARSCRPPAPVPLDGGGDDHRQDAHDDGDRRRVVVLLA